MFRQRFLSSSTTLNTLKRLYSSGTKKRDFYEVLGITKAATEKDVKAAYRKKALETHPDQGGNKDAFAEVNEAYESLSNKEKRQIYDQYGHEGMEMGGMGGGRGGSGMNQAHAEEIFKDFFGGGFGDMFGGGGGRGRGRQRVADTDIKVSVSLEELYSGVTKTTRVQRPSVCGTCKGEGAKSGKKQKCSSCSGSGQEVMQHRMGPGMVQQVITTCRKCKGAGMMVKPEDVCKPCRGEGYITKDEEVHIHIPSGCPDGATLVLEGQGGDMPNAEPGNINVHIAQMPHKHFIRRGSDLLVYQDISLAQALLGVEFKIKLLDSRTIIVKSKPGEVLQHNGVIKVSDEGMNPGSFSSKPKGDIYIIVKIAMPRTLTKDQEEALANVFGKPKSADTSNTSGVITGTVMKENATQLEQMKSAEWSANQHDGHGSHGRRGHGGGGHRGAPGGGGGQTAQCEHQ